MTKENFVSCTESENKCYIRQRGTAVYFTQLRQKDLNDLKNAVNHSTQKFLDLFEISFRAREDREMLVLHSSELIGILKQKYDDYFTFIFNDAVVFMSTSNCDIEEGTRAQWLEEEIDLSRSFRDQFIKESEGDPNKIDFIKNYYAKIEPKIVTRIGKTHI
ncbi:hypothetical protein MCEREM30_00004 [Paracoccaceae bacterium]